MLYFVVMPGLEHYGLAPLLQSEISARLMALLVGLSGVCGGVQLLLLLTQLGGRRTLGDLRGQLLLAGIGLSAAYFIGPLAGLDARSWPLFCYLGSAACGLILLMLPVPGERSGA